MLKERLKSMELKITELADYLQISRPTMYKFIEYYDKEEFELINPKVLKLFNYISEHELAGKKNVINYILTNLTVVKDVGDSKEIDIIKKIKKYVISNPESKKSKFITSCVTKNTFDEIIFYLTEIEGIVNKKRLSSEEKDMLIPYNIFVEELKKRKEQ